MVNKKILIRAATYVLAAAVGAGAMYFLKPEHKLAQLSKLLDEKYIGQADVTAYEDAAASAMVQALGDRYSYYIPQSQYDDLVNGQQNVYLGVGITIRGREDKKGIDVEAVEADGPAQKAGILPGDVIIAINGQSTEGLSVADVKILLQGEFGTMVEITVLRQQEELTIPVQIGKIPRQVVSGEMLQGNVAYVKISNLSFYSADAAVKEIDTLVQQGAQALILDVRNNPGGFTSEMNVILDHLLPEGVLFRSVDYSGKEDVDYSDEKCLEIPMAVLVNERSFSAAEFFAAALQEYAWATVVGAPTTGKGRYQISFTLNDGSAVNLSSGKYTTPKGVDLTEVGGVRPDIILQVDDQTAAMIKAGLVPVQEDPQVLAALELFVK